MPNDLSAHAMPRPPHPSRQPVRRSTIDRRWLSHWLAPCAIACADMPDPSAERAILHHRYLFRVDLLLSNEVSWETIRRGDLDSPLRPVAEFTDALTLAIERRRARMGRQKGKRRNNYAVVEGSGSE